MTGNIPEKLLIVALGSNNSKALNEILDDYFSELPTIDTELKECFLYSSCIREMYVYGDNHNNLYNILRKFTQFDDIVKIITLYPLKETTRSCEYDFRTLSGVYINMSVNKKKLRETGSKGVYG